VRPRGGVVVEWGRVNRGRRGAESQEEEIVGNSGNSTYGHFGVSVGTQQASRRTLPTSWTSLYPPLPVNSPDQCESQEQPLAKMGWT